ncbi:hypothetical protein Kpol_1060p53 [Vanderwaltozyma polyspora DSM 70294]|uniref:Protein kinase domain-containing protein n=1 Tax=Vanderwaltozyma polyspora (strain ATCC 22028 / DSM 70294 / BCRC 21397 / CBS 2163 / NBRC 10782 / NRRL Y-8283 / UCD 57-17) TaxID=436907 RepID=A7TK51_VANPO|nr:uncharacterized protein Kpol_1060p53 [Vanderwaltozyma polyspora DSM 70294]EDO17397.1 hypothetical protein Kpol_1060p53 [Vanderwaltozyma polyspora DSM 70294]
MQGEVMSNNRPFDNGNHNGNSNNNEEKKDFWNPAFMTQQRGFQQQQQQQPQQSALNSDIDPGMRPGQFIFNNPWRNDPASRKNSLAASPFPDNSMGMLDIDYRRRKSSLVTPPSRTANTNPFQSDKAANFPQSTAAYQQQRQFLANDNGMFADRLGPSMNFVDPNDFYRRQSVAAVSYQPDTGPTITANQSIPITHYRRLSAYPQSMTPSLHPIRREEPLVKQQPIHIPQMHITNSANDLQPLINPTPDYRRASLNSKEISPLNALTTGLITTYSLCSPDFAYKTSKNPKRVLTKPNEPRGNNGFDNVNSDYILYVNDVLGTEQNRKYLVLDILGQGTFGQVVKCQNVMTKEIVAVKVVKSRSEYVNQSISEVKILELIQKKIDPNDEHHFLRLYDTFVHKNHLCLVFELLSNNLYELLKQNQFHGLRIPLIRTFTKQLLDSLTVLKSSKLVHCDLKPENITLCAPDKPDIKVIDFGSSCEETRTLYTYIQSRFYRAPEIILGIPYSTSIDMWSLGCIVAELFLGIPIFPGASEFNQLTRIVNALGYPPTWMIERGKNSKKYLVPVDSHQNNDVLINIDSNMNQPHIAQVQPPKYRLKTVDEFNMEFHATEAPSKRYFKFEKLEEIIKNYRISKKVQSSPQLLEREMRERECLIHFLNGILNINPFERWTPQQAAMHPFITEQPFTGEWYPYNSFSMATPPDENGHNMHQLDNTENSAWKDPTAKDFDKLSINDKA